MLVSLLLIINDIIPSGFNSYLSILGSFLTRRYSSSDPRVVPLENNTEIESSSSALASTPASAAIYPATPPSFLSLDKPSNSFLLAGLIH